MNSNKYVNSWLENFEQQSMIRRGLIVSGNIIDLSFNQYNDIAPVNTVIQESLKAKGFEKVIFYSRLSGITGINSQEWDELTQLNQEIESGDDYDMGDDLDDNDLTNIAGQAPLAIEDFFATVETVMTKTKKSIAFIVDWSNYLFGQVNALSECERAWLQRISTSLRDAEQADRIDEIGKPQSIVIFLCNGNSVLPPTMYLNNPLFAEITIPLPNIEEREKMILARSMQFNIKESLHQGNQNVADFVTLTDRLMLRDIDNLVRLSRQQNESINFKNLVSLYRFGKKESPWEKLNYQRLKMVKEKLQERVKGQDKAIDVANTVLIRAFTGLSGLQHSAKARTPKGALFFVGPTGVGKTELAKSLAQFLFGDEDACIRFDMSEFNHEHADQRLVGAPPGYVGFEEGGQLTNAVKNHPFCLLLFDEIEKAHPRILDKFLQILEDGRLTDGKGETISFSDTFIVFTSNIGASDIQLSDDQESVASQFKSAVQSHFKDELKRPELLGRIGEANIIPFNFIQDMEVLKNIARAKIKPLENRLKEKWQISKLTFEDENKALNTLVEQTNKQHGGRGILNVLIKSLFDPLAEFIFEQASNPDSLIGKEICIIQAGKFFDFELR